MTSDLNFVEYVCDQINSGGQVSFKKMFGEYAIYYGEKVVALVCDHQLFVKPTAGGRDAMLQGSRYAKLARRESFANLVEASPYPGAKPYFLIGEQLDDRQMLYCVAFPNRFRLVV